MVAIYIVLVYDHVTEDDDSRFSQRRGSDASNSLRPW